MTKPWSVPEPPPAKPAISGLDYEGLQKCIHCGFCTQACPTYRQTGLEFYSPRGRLTLMRALAEGRLPLDGGLAEPLDLCLGCRACESACPSGVPYGHLLEEARVLTAAVKPPHPLVRFALRRVMPYPGRLRLLGRLAALAQRLGLFRLVPGSLGELARALPTIKPPGSYAEAGAEGCAGCSAVAENRASGPVSAEGSVDGPASAAFRTGGSSCCVGPTFAGQPVLFFRGCVQDAFLFSQNEAAVRVITALGGCCIVPEEQVCCGALHAHSGDLEGARALARRNIAAFERYPGPIVNHAGGCGAQLKSYGELLKDDPDWADRARAFSARVMDLSQWVTQTGLSKEALSPVRATVTYQDSCHLAHGQKIRKQPRDIIRAIPGVTYREMAQADQCCGSAGIYNLVQPDMARRVLTEKMAHVAETGAQVVVTANPGCYLQMRQGVRLSGLDAKVEVLSLAELVDRSLQRSKKETGQR